MTINTSIEERLSAVETAIAQLQNKMATPEPMNWLQQITGSFENDPAFEEVLAYGRAIRQGDESILDTQRQFNQ